MKRLIKNEQIHTADWRKPYQPKHYQIEDNVKEVKEYLDEISNKFDKLFIDYKMVMKKMDNICDDAKSDVLEYTDRDYDRGELFRRCTTLENKSSEIRKQIQSIPDEIDLSTYVKNFKQESMKFLDEIDDIADRISQLGTPTI